MGLGSRSGKIGRLGYSEGFRLYFFISFLFLAASINCSKKVVARPPAPSVPAEAAAVPPAGDEGAPDAELPPLKRLLEKEKKLDADISAEISGEKRLADEEESPSVGEKEAAPASTDARGVSASPKGPEHDGKAEEIRKKISELAYKKKSLSSSLERATSLSGPAKSRAVSGAAASTVKAGFHDDNEEFSFYEDFCKTRSTPKIPYPWDVSERFIIKALNSDSSPAFNADVEIRNAGGEIVFKARSPASGEIVLLPKMDLGKDYKNITDYAIGAATGRPARIQRTVEDRIACVLDNQGKLPGIPSVEICFLIDATGSMSDEIRQLQDVLFSIHARIISLPAKPVIRFSVVAYRDKTDAFTVKGVPFTANIDSFQVALESIKADGGGDYPEDIESGFGYCLDSLKWENASAKFVFLIADAPPHLEKKDRNYLWAARRFRENGVKVCPIGASGLDINGEFVFRQIGVITHGEFVFLHYGEQGESDGSPTASAPGKVSHHTGGNYTAQRLDDIVVRIISHELGYITPAGLLAHSNPAPEKESEELEARMVNLLRQVIREDDNLAGKVLAVQPIIAGDTSLAQLSEYIWELAIEKLPPLTKASVVERKRLEEIFKEQALSLTGALSGADEKKIGNLLNANYLLLSNLHYLGAVRVCHMRLVDCVSGSIVRAARVKL